MPAQTQFYPAAGGGERRDNRQSIEAFQRSIESGLDFMLKSRELAERERAGRFQRAIETGEYMGTKYGASLMAPITEEEMAQYGTPGLPADPGILAETPPSPAVPAQPPTGTRAQEMMAQRLMRESPAFGKTYPQYTDIEKEAVMAGAMTKTTERGMKLWSTHMETAAKAAMNYSSLQNVSDFYKRELKKADAIEAAARQPGSAGTLESQSLIDEAMDVRARAQRGLQRAYEAMSQAETEMNMATGTLLQMGMLPEDVDLLVLSVQDPKALGRGNTPMEIIDRFTYKYVNYPGVQSGGGSRGRSKR